MIVYPSCCAHPTACNSRALLAVNFGNPAFKRVRILLQFSEIGSWRIDYHAIHPISPHCSLMLLCYYSHMSSNLLDSDITSELPRNSPSLICSAAVGYAAEHLALASLRLHMCISPLMFSCVLYHIFRLARCTTLHLFPLICLVGVWSWSGSWSGSWS